MKNTTEKDTADVSIDLDAYCKAMQMAKTDGMEIEDWIEQLVREKLSTTATAQKRPIMFPADTVKLLEILLEASGTDLTIDDYAEEFLGDEITASLGGSCSAGVPEILDGSYQLEPGDMPAMKSVVEPWNAKKGGVVV